MPRSHRHFIPEIQALRAIAVLSVLIYHLWPALLPGGYVGVDVFFVISGYLITGLLLKEFEATGKINIADFYARRARRLLPAATLVCMAVAFAIPLFPRAQWDDIASSIIASALYVQNWFLAIQAVDYLASDDVKGPLNHFWSLSVEEQYYIIWPLVLLPFLSLARTVFKSPRAAFGWLIALIGACSLVYSVYLTDAMPGVAYFATTTRAWELAIGGALAVFQRPSLLSERWRAALGPLGLGAIGLASLAFSEDTHFPGYAALLPTAGAAAVILSSGAQAPWSARTLLDSRPFQALGDISYSLYLWHWPLIVLYGQATERAIGPRSGIALLTVSCVFAYLSKVLVEDYFRQPRFPLRQTLMVGAACIVLTAAAGVGYRAWTPRERMQEVGQSRPGALAMMNPAYDWRREDLSQVVPRPEVVRKDVPSAYGRKCHQNQRGTDVLVCDYGTSSSPVKVVVLGDSHATQWFPAFEEMAHRRRIFVRGVAKSACLFSLEPIVLEKFKRVYTECLEWSKNVIEWLARERPDLVVISQLPLYDKAALDGMAAAWSQLLKMGLKVEAIRSTPVMSIEPSKCIGQAGVRPIDCAQPRAAVSRPDPVLSVADRLNINTIQLTDYFCDAEYCPMVIGGIIAYRDIHHLTATFARTISQPLEERLFPTSRAETTGQKVGG